jgi:polysaccharide export outer membrane protein
VRTAALVVAAGLAAACGPSIPNYDYSQEPNPIQREFVIGVEDSLLINVWRNPELTTDARVRPDGTITMPLVGDLKAKGRTPSELRDEIQSRLARWIKDDTAVVTVAVTEVNSYRYTVSGEVNTPGVFTSRHYVTAVEAIAQAGGFTRYAERDKVKIQRRNESGELRMIPLSFDAIAKGDHPEMNVTVLAGDTIIVP